MDTDFPQSAFKQLKKKTVLKLAEEAGLVFNTQEPYNIPILPQHADALWNFYKLIVSSYEKVDEIAQE